MNAGDYGLNGKVYSVAEEEVFPPEAGNQTTVPLRTLYYDQAGKIIRLITYKGPSACTDQGYRYDSTGRLSVSGRYADNGSFRKEIEYQYDSNGRLAENRYYREDGAVFLTKRYRYTQDGTMSEEEHRSGNKVILTKKYSRDIEKKETIIATYGTDGQLLATEKARVDNQGSEEQEWTYSGQLTGYGSRQRITASDNDTSNTICRLADGSVYQNRVCDTREGSGLKRTVHRADGSILMEIAFDAAGDVQGIVRYSGDGGIEKMEKYTYQYDEQGNWTMRAVYIKLTEPEEWRLAGETRRTFHYYE